MNQRSTRVVCLKRAVKFRPFHPAGPQVLWFYYHNLAFSGHRFPAACASPWESEDEEATGRSRAQASRAALDRVTDRR